MKVSNETTYCSTCLGWFPMGAQGHSCAGNPKSSGQSATDEVSERKTWLPRFTSADFPFGMPVDSLTIINKRLEEFEKTCQVVQTNWEFGMYGARKEKEQHEYLIVTRPIKRGVTKAEIGEFLDSKSTGFSGAPAAAEAIALLSRIKREGIME